MVHRDAFRHAFEAVYGLPLSLDGISAAGRTDMWLLAEPLRRAGVPATEIRERMPKAFAVMQDYVDEHLGDLSKQVLPGVPDVLAELQRRDQLLGLLTGNLSRIAMAKMQHAGLARYFDTGGFGEESEVRAHLVPVAMAHASECAGTVIGASRTVVIGDTPLDIGAGAEHGTRTVGVATGPFTQQQLSSAGADLVFSSLDDWRAAVEALLGLVPG